MKIKKFKARNFAEALTLVKRELSENAIILASEEKGGLRPYVEVTAAVDYDAECKDARPEKDRGNPGFKVQAGEARKDLSRITSQHSDFKAPPSRSTMSSPAPRERMPGTAPAPSLSSPSPSARRTEGLKCDGKVNDRVIREIRDVREGAQETRSESRNLSLSSKKKSLLQFLTERSVSEEIALRLCDKANDVSDISSLLSNDIRVKGNNNDKKALMLLGPTGVGKSTTIAKLSVCAIRRGKRTGIISLDTYRIGAIEQMRIYARIMGIPLSVVSTPRELQQSLSTFARERDVIFVDTPGRNPKDREYINDMVTLCASVVPMEVHLLMSANSDYEFMIESSKAYRRVPIDYVGFTKVDEAVRFGSLYNFLLNYQKPVAYVTTGQKVPDDIEFATVDNLAQLILTKGCYKC